MAPEEIQYGQTIAIHTPQARDIKWVELIWPMATTHSCETGQRIVDVPFEVKDFCHIQAGIPKEQNLAPPGWYMLFLVNRAGVPSVAKWVHLTGGRKPSHEPAMIKELIDMRLTGKEIAVPGTEFMDRPPQLTEKLQATEKKATVSNPAPGKKKNQRKQRKKT